MVAKNARVYTLDELKEKVRRHLCEQRIRDAGRKFCLDILNALIETADTRGDCDVRGDLIQLLEEKFSLKIRICGNCKNFFVWSIENCELDDLIRALGGPHKCRTRFNDFCSEWTPKEVPEKPSSA